jgi:hypothetical protein
MIEHPEKRIVHIMFKAPFERNENEFSLRLRLFLLGKLDTHVDAQAEKVEEYITKIKEDDMEDIGSFPLKIIPC